MAWRGAGALWRQLVDEGGWEFWCRGHCAWGDMETTATRQIQIEDKTAPIASLELPRLLADLDREIKAACVTMLEELSQRPGA
jgi:hypothetical protein